MSAPPPSGAPPPGMNREVVENVRKKMAPPSGPPPAGMIRGVNGNSNSGNAAFSAPKKLKDKDKEKDRYRDAIGDRDDFDDGYNDRHGPHSARGREGSNHRGDGSKDLKISTEDDTYDYTYAPTGYRERDTGRGRESTSKGHGGNDDDRGNHDDRYYDEDEENDDYYDEEEEEEDDRDYSRDRRDDDRGHSRSNISPKPRPKDSRDWEDNAPSQPKKPDNTAQRGGSDGRPLSAAASEIQQKQGVSAALATLRSSHGASNSSLSNMAAAPLGRSVGFNFSKILNATYRELKVFVTSPCPPGVTIRCYIERNRSGTKMLSPFYSVCADLEDGTGRELMVCRKIMRSRSPHYVFSLKMDDLWRKREQRSRLFLGKLRATTSSEYVLFDNGICAAPEDTKVEDEEICPTVGGDVRGSSVLARKFERDSKGQSEDVSLYRKELAVIHYNTKTRPCQSGVRGMEVCIPNTFAPDAAAASETVPSATSFASAAAPKGPGAVFNIAKPFEKVRNTGKQNELFAKSCFILHERNSRYDPLSSCLVDFKGRANMASVKNCQLVESSPATFGPSSVTPRPDQDKEYKLQLGKTTEDCFNMDFRHPLSLLQAFAISISRFDANLSW